MPLPARLRLVPLLVLPVGLALLAAPAAAEPAAEVRISEVECGGEGPDWVELVNTGAEPAELGGWYLRDDEDGRDWRIPDGTVLAPGARLVLTGEETEGDGGFDFVLGSADQVRLYLPDGVTEVDAVAWTEHARTTYIVVDGELAESAEATPGEPNAEPAAAPEDEPEARSVVINELSAPDAWVELKNTGEVAVDLTDWTLAGSDPEAERLPLAPGTAIAPGERIVVETAGPADPLEDGAVRLLAPDGDVVDEVSPLPAAPEDAGASDVRTAGAEASGDGPSLQRCPDGTGALAGARSTPGTANSCAAPVVIHEVSSQEDFVELRNAGPVTVDLGGYVVKDGQDVHAHTIPAGTTVPAGGLLLLDGDRLGFDLGEDDAVRLFAPGGERIGEVSWIGPVEPSFGLCANAFAAQEQASPGAENACPAPAGSAEPAEAAPSAHETAPSVAPEAAPAAEAATAAPVLPAATAEAVTTAPAGTAPTTAAPQQPAPEGAEETRTGPLAATGAEVSVAAVLAVLALAAGWQLLRR